MPDTKTIRGFLIDPENNIAEERTIEKSLDSYYATLRCSCIDIVSRVIGGECYDIICDDEGLLKDEPYVAAVDHYGNVAFVGAIFLVNYDGGEDVTDLSDDDIANLSAHLQGVWVIRRAPGGSRRVHVSHLLYGVC